MDIPSEIQTQIATGVAWLWEHYGGEALQRLTGRVVDEVKWRWGIVRYYNSLYERVGFVRVLGRMESEPLENIFTHVNVLDRLTAERRYDIAKLLAEHAPRDYTWTERVTRIAGEEAVAEHAKLFILGKPGAGKTTFLKHTALRAIQGQIKKVPIFVTLKELSDAGMEIVPFIVYQFKVHQFPEPELFVERLLQDGRAIVLLDGLDEVNLEGNKRADMIRQLNDFVYQYSACPMLLTCRVAATDYSFTQFEYVEMADFDTEQMGRYIDLWFVGNEVKRTNCRKALLEDEANRGVRELAQVPLLLALLCLVYEERNEFPPNRDEIYEEATRALLVRWDSSRNIARDTVYQQLSLKHKQKMLAHIAATTFADGDYFLPEKRVVQLIEDYLRGVPGLEEPEGDRVLRAMEDHHGIFVEQATRIHSFSHLTLQEYYTASYIKENERKGAVEHLMHYVDDNRWHEVFLLVAGMLDDATEFAELYLATVESWIASDAQLLTFMQWAEQKRTHTPVAYRLPAVRAFLLYLALDLVPDRARDRAIFRNLTHAIFRALDLDLARARNLARAGARVRSLAPARDLVRARARAASLAHASALEAAEKLEHEAFQSELTALSLPRDEANAEMWQRFAAQFTAVLGKYEEIWNPFKQILVTKEETSTLGGLAREQLAIFQRYLEANLLLVRCLQVAYLPDREAIENRLLLPPKVEPIEPEP